MFRKRIKALERARLLDELKINELRLRLTPNALNDAITDIGRCLEKQEIAKANERLDVFAKRLRVALSGTSR